MPAINTGSQASFHIMASTDSACVSSDATSDQPKLPAFFRSILTTAEENDEDDCIISPRHVTELRRILRNGLVLEILVNMELKTGEGVYSDHFLCFKFETQPWLQE